MIGNLRFPAPFSRIPVVWAIALVLFVLAGVIVATHGKSENALILAVVGVLLVIRGAFVFNSRRPSVEATPLPTASPASTPATAAAPRPEIPKTVIEAQELSKRYGDIVAVDSISFSVQ